MIKENKIKKYVVVIICLLGMLILSGKTENVFANDKKSKDMENSLLSFYIKDVSNVESIKYIPLDKKIIGNKRITDKSNVVDIGFGEYYINEYSYAAEPPVQFRLSHLSRRNEPL